MIHDYIFDLNTEIKNQANRMTMSIYSEFKAINFSIPQISRKNSSSYRPWVVLGGGGAAIGFLGMFFSDSVKSWQVILTCVGAISVGFGAWQNSQSSKEKVNINYTSVKNYYIEHVEKVINKISQEWDLFIKNRNEELVKQLNEQISNEKILSKALYKTYYLESIKVSMMEFINSLDNLPQDDTFLNSCASLKDKFVSSIELAINKASNNQISHYSEIIDILKQHGI